jgi:hypothetical protein
MWFFCSPSINSSKETCKYIDTLIRRIHSSKDKGPKPEELSCDDLER